MEVAAGSSEQTWAFLMWHSCTLIWKSFPTIMASYLYISTAYGLYSWRAVCRLAFITSLLELNGSLLSWNLVQLGLLQLNMCVYLFDTHISHVHFGLPQGNLGHFYSANMLWHHTGLSVKLHFRGTWRECQTRLAFSPSTSLSPVFLSVLLSPVLLLSTSGFFHQISL